MQHVVWMSLSEMTERDLLALRDIGCRIQIPLAGLDDAQFAALQWLRVFGERLSLEQPQGFNAKLQWLKLHYRRPDMPALVDKLAVRDHVASRVGAEVLRPLLGAAPRLSLIDPDDLPERFMVKCTHGSGWTLAVRDKAGGWAEAVAQTDRWLAMNYHDFRREWVYRDVPPRVIVEPLIGPEEGPRDYKFFCYGGTARFIQVDIGRFGTHTRALFDRDWRRLPCRLNYPDHPDEVPPPPHLPQLIELAEALAEGHPFMRVDLYDEDGQVSFGELTFYPGNGFERFTPGSFDLAFGAPLYLPDALTGGAGT